MAPPHPRPALLFIRREGDLRLALERVGVLLALRRRYNPYPSGG